MHIERLNEELKKIINELSDDTKASYLAGRQAQLDKAKKAMDKANAMVKKSDARQIANLPTGIDEKTATSALEDLKYEMRRIDSGSDWRLEEKDGWLCLSVRYWGDWEGDDGSGDYDWQTLSNDYRDKLNSILTKIQKKYGVQIHEPGSEKNWLDFEIKIIESTYDKIIKLGFRDVTGPQNQKKGVIMFLGTKSSRGYRLQPLEDGNWWAGALNNFGDNTDRAYRYNGKNMDRFNSKEEALQWILDNATAHLERMKNRAAYGSKKSW